MPLVDILKPKATYNLRAKELEKSVVIQHLKFRRSKHRRNKDDTVVYKSVRQCT